VNIMSKHAKPTSAHTLGAPTRGAHVIVEREHDPYKAKAKLAEPTVCPQCRASFVDGRWQWVAAAADAHEELCPACRRVRDKFPAGYVTLEGEFLAAHRDELLQLVKHHADRAKAEHPLERVMDVEDKAGTLELTTTDMHLARGIGEALHHAYHGELQFHYNKAQDLLRVHWRR
jgi:NMD protein affecting ribosome stability and mRNA decay